MSRHTILLRTLNTLYQQKNQGLCHGLGYMAKQAMLLDTSGISAFNYRLDDIFKQIRYNNLNKFLHSNHLNPANNQKRVDIQAFFDGVILYQNSGNFPKLFPHNIQPKQDAALAQPLAISATLENIGLANYKSFSGIYNWRELNQYFKTLKETLDKTPYFQTPWAMILSNSNHTISVGYSIREKKYLIFNANDMPIQYINSTNQITNKVMSGFSINEPTDKKSYTAFVTKAYALSPNQKVFDATWQRWQNNKFFTDDKYINKKVKLVDKTGASWLWAAAESGQTQTVKKLLKHGADPNTKTKDQRSALYVATTNYYYDIVDILLSAGAQTDFAPKAEQKSWSPRLMHHKEKQIIGSDWTQLQREAPEDFNTSFQLS